MDHKEKLLAFISQFSNQRIGVVGDVMLDIFTYGHVERQSPEAPVPIVSVDNETHMPGGAANVAANIASLGGQAFLFGFIGTDTFGDTLRLSIKKSGVLIDGLVSYSDSRPTITKHRIVSEGSHLIRVDTENVSTCTSKDQDELYVRIEKEVPTLSALLIADYAKGCLSEELVKKVLLLAKEHAIPVIVDTKPVNVRFFRDVALMTPNKSEALAITGMKTVKDAAKALYDKLESPILVTCGPDGMVLFDGGDCMERGAVDVNVRDVSGAGDTVAATAALMLASGSVIHDAVHVSNVAASLVVMKSGTATVDTNELKDAIRNEV